MTQKTRYDILRDDSAVTPEPKPKRFPVICQQWEESERGWGVRPDGYSLHLTEEDREAYVTRFIKDEMKLNPSGVVPNEYSRACGTPYIVDATEAVYDEVSATPNGKRYSGSAPKGAKNGWVSVP